MPKLTRYKSEARERLAAKMGMSTSTLINYMAGRRGMSWKMAKRASEVTNTPVDWWMNKEVERLAITIGYPR